MKRAAVLLGAFAAIALAGCSASTEPIVDTDAAVPFAIDRDFPDPDVLEVDGVYYLYATQSGDLNVQVATSTDLVDFEFLDSEPLPDLPAWAVVGDTWAPDVTRVGESFVMYFTAANPLAGRQCIGVATSTTPVGPFEPTSDEPLVCPVEEGGAIDAATFEDDDGTLYLLWKNDGNAIAHDTIIHVSPLTPDGLSLAGEASELIQQDQAWEGRLVEAPTLVKHDGKYVLFYSANDYYGLEYAIGYATADSVLGPYSKSPEPLLSTESSDFAYYGPGGQDVVGESIVFHSWSADHTYRGVNVAPLEWVDSAPVITLPRPVD